MWLLWLFACTGKVDTSFDKQAMVQDMAEGVYLPTSVAVGERGAALSSALTALCEAPDAARLTAAQEAWRSAQGPLKQAQLTSFGPAEELRTFATLDFWPIRPDSIDALLASDTELTGASLAAQGATVRGYPVVEYLIFDVGGGGDAATLAALTDTTTTPTSGARRCQYLVALGEDIAAVSAAYQQAWSPDGGGYVTELATAGAGSAAWPTTQSAISALINLQLSEIEATKGSRIGAPMGTRNGGVPQPDAVEAPYSDASLANIAAVLDGVEAAYLGASDRQGMTDFMQVQRPDTDTTVRAQLDAAEAAVAAIPPPLQSAVEADLPSVTAAYDAVDALFVTWQTEVVLAFGVTITFNDNDGD